MQKKYILLMLCVLSLFLLACNEKSAKNPDMVLVVGGTFHNGTCNVSLSNYYISRYEVSQAEYSALMSNMNIPGPPPGVGMGDNYPVYYVDWFDAIEYCNRRSIAENFSPVYSFESFGTNPENWPEGWNTEDENHAQIVCDWTKDGYRLPTEMEWMFAARGGTKTLSFNYSGSSEINDVAWFQGNNDPIGAKERATKQANELGLYDMSGNVWEWVWDIIELYPTDPQTNPHGPATGFYRGRRGGSWYGMESYCRVVQRDHRAATFTSWDLGFRVARNYAAGD